MNYDTAVISDKCTFLRGKCDFFPSTHWVIRPFFLKFITTRSTAIYNKHGYPFSGGMVDRTRSVVSGTNVDHLKARVNKNGEDAYDVNSQINTRPSTVVAIPATFDGRVVWGSRLSKVYDQHTCGNCWAYATTSVLETRINLLSHPDEKPVTLSRSKLLLCNWRERASDEFHAKDAAGRLAVLASRKLDVVDRFAIGCQDGTTLVEGLEYTYRYGTCVEACVPLTEERRACPTKETETTDLTRGECHMCEDTIGNEFDTCVDGTSAVFNYRSCAVYTMLATADMYYVKRDILLYGPVGVAVFIDITFARHDGKTTFDVPYVPKTMDTSVIGHMMVVVGWETNPAGELVWILQNSWGAEWGEAGYGRVTHRSLRPVLLDSDDPAIGLYGSQFASVLPSIGTIPQSKRVQELDARTGVARSTILGNDTRTRDLFESDGIPLPGQRKIADGLLDTRYIDQVRRSIDIDSLDGTSAASVAGTPAVTWSIVVGTLSILAAAVVIGTVFAAKRRRALPLSEP